MSKIKLLIVDDHRVVRNGLELLFQNESQFNVVATVESGEKALDAIKKYKPDVVLTDVSMPGMNGIELTKMIRDNYSEVNVLVLSMHDDDEYVLDALDAGAMGYITKDSDEVEIKEAIINIANGKMYYSSSLSDILAKKLIKKSKAVKVKLTARELEVMELIVNGQSNKEIASLLFVSKRTIDNHRSNLMQKINAKNTADIVRIALTNELVKIDKKKTY